MGYLREKYGEPEIVDNDSKWFKFTIKGQKFKGTVEDFEEGLYGTDVIFTNGKRVTLNNTVLLKEVTKLDPVKGDVLEIEYLGEAPKTPGSTRNPAKLYLVTKNGDGAGSNGAPPSAPAAPVDASDEPF